VLASAKTGLGVEDILEAIIERIPAPKGDPEAPLKALLVDAWFDNYVGVVMLVRVFDGTLRPKDRIRLMATGSTHLCEQVGVFTPKAVPRDALRAGEVGYIISGIKELQAAKVGDTVTLFDRPASEGLAGLQGNQVAGLRRALSGRVESVRLAARVAREAEAQRRVAALRTRGLAGARLRFSLRLSRPAAHGDRPGASRARVRPGPDHHRADRRL
jgi:GTP-binding protein LepA